MVGDTAHALTAEQATGKLVVVTAREGAPFRIRATSPLAGAAGIAIVGGPQLTAAAAGDRPLGDADAAARAERTVRARRR